MDGGPIVAGAVVIAVALFETALPLMRSALRRWRDGRARAEEEETQSSPADAGLGETCVTSASASVRCPPSSAQDGAEDENESGGGQSPRTSDVGQLEGQAIAEDLWAEARTMTHRYKPDWEKDREYLDRVYGAANLGHLDALMKLGEYAFRRRAFVEAYYWTALADLKGAKGLEKSLRKIKTAWLAAGCPTQRSNSYDDFSERQGSFARALLRIRAAVEAPLGRARMKELAAEGCEEAKLFLGRSARK